MILKRDYVINRLKNLKIYYSQKNYHNILYKMSNLPCKYDHNDIFTMTFKKDVKTRQTFYPSSTATVH